MRRWIVVILLLSLWWSRLHALQALPLHNDEGLHLTRAIEVWNLHLFWDISDGKVINHWLIALFYPQNAPDFVARIATVFMALPGLAAGYALLRRLAGPTAAFLGSVFWLSSPYLFFFERLALSDAEAGSLVVLTLWAMLRLVRTARPRDALLTGLALALAALFKLTAAPFALMVALVILFLEQAPLAQRVRHLVIIAAVGAACFAVPLGYLALRGSSFGTALGWLDQTGMPPPFQENVSRLWAQLSGYGLWLWVLALIVGLILLALIPRRAASRPLERHAGLWLLAAAGLPLLLTLVMGTAVLPRHFVVALPLALILAGAGWGKLLARLPSARLCTALVAGMAALLLAEGAGFALTAYRNPAHLVLPAEQQHQYISDQSAGFGLREAVQAFPETLGAPSLPIIASMFPDGCRRANFYAAPGFTMDCPPAPGREAIEAALQASGVVYVLGELPSISIDPATLDGRVTRLAEYPRPGEPETATSVVLWRVEHGQ